MFSKAGLIVLCMQTQLDPGIKDRSPK